MHLSYILRESVHLRQLRATDLDSTNSEGKMKLYERYANTLSNYCWGLLSPQHIPDHKRDSVKIVAHRGVHENNTAIENTREAFAAAVANGIWGVELDVRWTKDGVPVVFHDPDLRRLHRRNEIVAETKWDELKKVAPSILSFEEVVSEFAGRAHLMIEIKEPVDAKRESGLKDILKFHAPLEHYHLMALDPRLLEPISFAPKSSFVAIDWMNMAKTIKTVLELGHGAVSGHFMLLGQKNLEQLKEKGIHTGTGFIESRGAFYREISRDIDWIFTNHPLRLKSFLK